MCLEKVTRKGVVLRKDLEVWGLVKAKAGGDLPLYSDQKLNKRINKAKNLYGKSRVLKVKGYKAGFHRFLSKANAIKYKRHLELIDHNGKIRLFIIPKGEKVTYGKTKIWGDVSVDTVVSQVLINPRIKKKP